MDLRSYLELFLFDAQKQRQKVGALSGGERARVALAKVLREGANLLVFDEPTNDLDLPTLAALEEMLEGYAGSVLVVTHDRAFLDRVATAILAFEGDPSGRAGDGHAVRRRLRGLRRAAGRPARAARRRARGGAEAGRIARQERQARQGRRRSHPGRAARAQEIVDAIDMADKRVAAVRRSWPTPRSTPSAATRSRPCRPSSSPPARRPRGSRSAGNRSKPKR